jgi:hypothetical protein
LSQFALFWSGRETGQNKEENLTREKGRSADWSQSVKPEAKTAATARSRDIAPFGHFNLEVLHEAR